MLAPFFFSGIVSAADFFAFLCVLLLYFESESGTKIGRQYGENPGEKREKENNVYGYR